MDEFSDARGDFPAGGRFEQHRYFWPSLQEVGIGMRRVEQERHAMMEEGLTDFQAILIAQSDITGPALLDRNTPNPLEHEWQR